VVVVTAGGEEQRARVFANGDFEAEDTAVEGLGLREVAHLQVHVPDARPGRHPFRTVLAVPQLPGEVL
jgi:hypothetical protein